MSADPPFVFISYSRKDSVKAARLQRHLEADGISTWRDTRLIGGRRFDDVLERKVRESSCVLVLWSKQSVASAYVKNESALALELEKLVPAKIEECEVPMTFRYLHTHRLTDWDAPLPAPDYDRMKADLAGYLSMPAPGAPAGGVHRRIRLLGMLAEWVGRYSAPVAATAALAAAGLAVHRSGVESPPPPPPVRQPTVVSESEAADRLLLLGRTYEIRSRSGAAMRLHVQEVRLDARAATVRVSDTNGVDHTLTLALEEKRQAVLSTGRHWIKLDGVADNGALFSFAMQ